MVPMSEETSGGACHIMIPGQLIGLQAIANSRFDGNRFCDKGPPIHLPIFAGMPGGKQASHFGKHPSCEPNAIGAPASMFEPFEEPDDMCPADLSLPLVVCIVSREHVRTDDTAKDFAEDSFEYLCSSGGCQREEHHGRGRENPKPDSLAHTLPARLVHVEEVLFGQSLSDFLTAWCKRFGDFLMKFAHRAKGDIDPEQGCGKLLTPSSIHPMHGGEIGQKGGKPGTETGSSLRRQIRPGDSTAGTFHTAQLVFGDVRLDLGNVRHLAPEVIAEQSAAIHTRGEEVCDTSHTTQEGPLGSNQPPREEPDLCLPPGDLVVLQVCDAWISCVFSSSVCLSAIRRPRFGGIGRILGEQGNLTLQLLDSRAQLQQDLHDHFPVAVRNGCGFFPSHGESQYQDLPAWQGESGKRRDIARLKVMLNGTIGSNTPEMGGPTHSAR